jgi:hypothetical protein
MGDVDGDFATLRCAESSGPVYQFSQTALSEEECALLATQITRITDTSLRDLSDEERQQALAQIDHSEAIAGCLEGGLWDRAGYECALLAQTADDLNQCLMFAE